MKQNMRYLLIAATFTAFTAIGAFIKIPIPPYPVPMTLQTAFIFLAGLLLPAREAFFSQLTYLLLGLIGIPIFSNGGGIGYVFDPTFGYLLSFLIAAPAMRVLANRTLYSGKRVTFGFFAFLIILFIQLAGVSYMAAVSAFYLHTPITFERAAYVCLIFLPLDCLKLVFAVLLAQTLRRRASKIFA